MAGDGVYCVPENAEKMWEWLHTRGGIAVWASVNLSNPTATWSTPARTPEGAPTPKPNWQADEAPAYIVTEPARVLVTPFEIVKRFHVGVRVSDNGCMIKVTDAGSRRIRAEVEKAAQRYGMPAWHAFDYDAQDALILVQTEAVPIAQWMQRVNERKRGGNGKAA